ncbi:enoyl-CoA hydratase [compost metagenome]
MNHGPSAVQMTKKAMKISYLSDLGTSLDLLAGFQGIAQRTGDHFEALKAFEEKRQPNFKGN